MAAGLGVRLVTLVLTPTVYGVENTILHLPNPFLTERADGWVTLFSAAVGIGTFVAVGLLRGRREAERTHEDELRAELHEESRTLIGASA